MALPKLAFGVPPSYPSPVGLWHLATFPYSTPDRKAQNRVPSMGGAPASLPSTEASTKPARPSARGTVGSGTQMVAVVAKGTNQPALPALLGLSV